VGINVMFTDCKDVCPLETAMLVQLRKVLGDRVGRDIFFYSISIDPGHDTPGVLKAYAEKFGAGGPGWQFLTGKPEDVFLIVKKMGLIKATDGSARDAHSSIFMVGHEPTGQWMRNSALDNPKFLAGRMASFLGWRDDDPGRSYAEARPLTFDASQHLFQSRCGVCHTIGQGDKVGPDLRDVTSRRDRGWLARYIQAPDELLAAGDPVATSLYRKYKEVRMPNLHLSSADVAGLIAYLQAQAGPRVEQPRKEAAQTPLKR
jgi:protein SCO1/2